MINVYERQDQNKRRSLAVLLSFVFFIGLVSWFLAKIFGYGWPGVVLALILALVTSFASYWWGDKLILSLSQAKPASRNKDFNFYTVSENLAMASRIPLPKLYVIEDSAPNAFATGRDPEHAVICVTRGLLLKLNRSQLEGVIAHEISHISNYDTRLMCLVTILVGTVVLLGDWFFRGTYLGSGRKESRQGNAQTILFIIGIFLILLSPIIAQLIQLAISRRREFLADSSAALLTRFPEGLAQALEIISKDTEPLEIANKATAHLFIANPLKGKNLHWLEGLFNTHPPIEERIKVLRQMV
jgi:heat shock protein HtpX